MTRPPPEGRYAVSANGGFDWRVEQVPWRSERVKNPALAVDAMGDAHVVYVLKVRDHLVERTKDQTRGAYWQLRYVRRQRQGGWVDDHDTLASFTAWHDSGPGRDILADWPDVAADRRGNLHVGFHGSVSDRRNPDADR